MVALSANEGVCFRHHFYFVSGRRAEALAIVEDVLARYKAGNAEQFALHADDVVSAQLLHSKTSAWSALRTTFASKASRFHFTKAVCRAGQGLTRSTGGHDFLDTRQPPRSDLLHQPDAWGTQNTTLKHLGDFVRAQRAPVEAEECKSSALDVTFSLSAPQELHPDTPMP